MNDIQIIDFSVQVQADFKRPRIKSDADPVGIARKLVEEFGEVMDVQDAAFVSTDDIFDYSLTIPMFKGAGNVVLNSQSFSVTFKNGRNRQVLDYIVNAICQICGIVANQPIRQIGISFTAVATFKESTAYVGFMKRFEVPDKGVTAGGVILFASAGIVPGEIRLSVEKSLGYDNSLFISGSLSTPEPVRVELFHGLGDRLAELMQTQGLNLVLPP